MTVTRNSKLQRITREKKTKFKGVLLMSGTEKELRHHALTSRRRTNTNSLGRVKARTQRKFVNGSKRSRRRLRQELKDGNCIGMKRRKENSKWTLIAIGSGKMGQVISIVVNISCDNDLHLT